jgi:hypothetical protein
MIGHNGALALAALSLERRRRIGKSRRQYKMTMRPRAWLSDPPDKWPVFNVPRCARGLTFKPQLRPLTLWAKARELRPSPYRSSSPRKFTVAGMQTNVQWAPPKRKPTEVVRIANASARRPRRDEEEGATGCQMPSSADRPHRELKSTQPPCAAAGRASSACRKGASKSAPILPSCGHRRHLRLGEMVLEIETAAPRLWSSRCANGAH